MRIKAASDVSTRWIFNVIKCDQTKLTTLHFESHQFAASTPAFNLSHLHLAPLLGVTLFEFCWDLPH